MKLLQEGEKKRGGGGVKHASYNYQNLLVLKKITNDALSHSYPHNTKN